MISDTLSDAYIDLREYLQDPATADCYKDPALHAWIRSIMAQMDRLRQYLDNPASIQAPGSTI